MVNSFDNRYHNYFNIGEKLKIGDEMYIIFLLIAILLILLDLKPAKKLKYRSNAIIIDKLNNKLSWIQYKKDSKKYKETQTKIKKAGLELSTETYQTIKIILPIVTMILYILFKILNYTNLQVNTEELREAAKVLNDETILNIKLNINSLVVLLIGFISSLLPDLIIKFLIKSKTYLGQKEALTLQTYTIMLLRTAKPVKQILISLYERTSIFKHQLELAINKYSSDPDKALSDLKGSVTQDNFKIICISLQQALNNDRDLSIRYLENNRNLAREVNKQIRIRNQTREEMVGMMIMMIPMLLTLCIIGYPWLIYTLKSISSIPL